jgi:hypothetical protein
MTLIIPFLPIIPFAWGMINKKIFPRFNPNGVFFVGFEVLAFLLPIGYFVEFCFYSSHPWITNFFETSAKFPKISWFVVGICIAGFINDVVFSVLSYQKAGRNRPPPNGRTPREVIRFTHEEIQQMTEMYGSGVADALSALRNATTMRTQTVALEKLKLTLRSVQDQRAIREIISTAQRGPNRVVDFSPDELTVKPGEEI